MDEHTRLDRRTRRRYEALTERLDREVEEVSAGVFAVPSRSNPHDFHLVVLQDGQMVCDCPGAKAGQPCRHVEAVIVYRGNAIYSHRATKPRDDEFLPRAAQPEPESWYSAPRPLKRVAL
jgi:hypothetical protein